MGMSIVNKNDSLKNISVVRLTTTDEKSIFNFERIGNNSLYISTIIRIAIASRFGLWQ